MPSIPTQYNNAWYSVQGHLCKLEGLPYVGDLRLGILRQVRGGISASY